MIKDKQTLVRARAASAFLPGGTGGCGWVLRPGTTSKARISIKTETLAMALSERFLLKFKKSIMPRLDVSKIMY